MIKKNRKPISIYQEDDDLYPDDSVGAVFDKELIALTNNDILWERRWTWITTKARKVKSKKFRRLIKSSSPQRLKAICNIAYLMKAKGDDAWLVPKNVSCEEAEAYWEDVWNTCSIKAGLDGQPHNWNTKYRRISECSYPTL